MMPHIYDGGGGDPEDWEPPPMPAGVGKVWASVAVICLAVGAVVLTLALVCFFELLDWFFS